MKASSRSAAAAAASSVGGGSSMCHPVQSLLSISACLLVLLVLISSSSACFIRNCPAGGKRSISQLPEFHRRCMRCGPNGLGQCIGPNICCGSAIGCYINTVEALSCRKENEVLTPCKIEGRPCGIMRESHCVADGVCCNDEKCVVDEDCVEGMEGGVSKAGATYSADLVRVLKQLLGKKPTYSATK